MSNTSGSFLLDQSPIAACLQYFVFFCGRIGSKARHEKWNSQMANH
jgi:hypothetical protein